MLSDLIVWDRNFERLRRHVLTELSFELATHNGLHRWVDEQRHAGMRGSLDASRRRRLNDIGFLFTLDVDTLAAQTWELHFAHFEAQVKKDAEYAPSRYGASRRMYAWVQRQNALIEAGAMDSNRLARLHQLTPRLFRKGHRRHRSNMSVGA